MTSVAAFGASVDRHIEPDAELGVIRVLLRRAGLRKGMRVLNLGCGPGDVSLLAAQIVGPGGAVLGVDEDERMIRTARRRTAETGVRHASFLCARVNELADLFYPFDAAISCKPLALRQFAQLVRSGGPIVWVCNDWHNFIFRVL